jgi:hypothetical protein
MRQRAWMGKSQKEDFSSCSFIWTQWKKNRHCDYLAKEEPCFKLYNRVEDNFHLSNKKALLLNMSAYYKNHLKLDPNICLPESFHIKYALPDRDLQYKAFIDRFKEKER